jgi:drug/metabolite transporter (DMT)-like permease
MSTHSMSLGGFDIGPWLWAVFTVIAAGSQTLRNAMQRGLTATLGTAGATQVRFLFGLPFAMLFLSVILAVTGHGIPRFDAGAALWICLGASTQIAATALMLGAMKERSFVVTTALIKIEPVWVALFGLVFLGEHLSWELAAAILIATTGVMLVSWPTGAVTARSLVGRSGLLGIAAGMMFGVSAIGYRGGILGVKALGENHFVVAATSVLVLGLIMQVGLLAAYLALFDRKTLAGIIAAWRPSIVAGFMGALASQFWFLAFAVESAARIRTLALVEIFFAQILSRTMFKQGVTWREGFGIALIVAGVVWLLRGT